MGVLRQDFHIEFKGQFWGQDSPNQINLGLKDQFNNKELRGMGYLHGIYLGYTGKRVV